MRVLLRCNTIFGGVVGGTAKLTSVTTDAAGTTAINGGAVSTTGTQTYNDAVTLATNNATLTGTTVTFNSTIDSATAKTLRAAGHPAELQGQANHGRRLPHRLSTLRAA